MNQKHLPSYYTNFILIWQVFDENIYQICYDWVTNCHICDKNNWYMGI